MKEMNEKKKKKPEPDKKLKDIQMGLTSDKNLKDPETGLAISPKKAKGTAKELGEERERKTEIKIKQIQRTEEEQRAKDLASKLGFPYIDLRISLINDRALILTDEEESKQAKTVIFQKRQKELYLAVFDPNLKATKSFVESLENQAFQTKIFITSQSNLEKAWKRYKILKVKKAKITKTAEIDIERLKEIQEEIASIRDLKEKISRVDLTATQLLNTIMAAGLKLEASDVHLETEAQEKTRLRFRIDGILQDVTDILSSSYQLLLSRIKILSSLKLNVHNAPQDGRFSFKTEEKEIEIRTSIIPAEYGENIVMRILDPKSIGLKLEDLGIQDHDLKIIASQLKKPNGMIITTGPTGSGKTTLLYAFLKKVNRPEIKVITLENPIEYHLEGIEQTQVNADKGYTFAAGLRSIVRQDPDMILVGEIRDKETAETAINAALTGHLVFSTLHTNDAAGAVPRMVDMKVNPNLIPPALNVVIAQRLIRKACKKCAKEVKPNKETLEKIKDGLKDLPKRAKKPKLEDIKILEASKEGCEFCNFTGYKGRIGVFELFVIDDPMEKTILKTPSIADIRETAIKAGMVTMKQDGLVKLLAKITTIDEIERVLGA
jgi:type IV pilus assembly protein PilB